MPDAAALKTRCRCRQRSQLWERSHTVVRSGATPSGEGGKMWSGGSIKSTMAERVCEAGRGNHKVVTSRGVDSGTR